MTLLSRVEAAQDAQRTRLQVMRSEVPALLEVLASACTLELSKLVRAEPSLAEWTHGAVGVISQLVPVKSAVLVIDLPGAPPVSAGYGALADAGAQVLHAGRVGERVLDAEVLIPLTVGGLVVGSLGLGGVAAVIRESALMERVTTQVAVDLVDIAKLEQAARAEAPIRVRTAVGALGRLDEEPRFDELASAMAQLPDVVGVTLRVEAPWLVDAIAIQRGWTSSTGRFVHEVRGERASIGLVVDGAFSLQGSITGDVISETVSTLLTGVRAAELAWTESHLVGRDATTGLYSRPAFVAVLDSAITRAEHRNEQVGLVAVAVDQAAEMRAQGGSDRVDTMMGRMADALSSEWGDNAVARVSRDHLAVIVTGADELELISARDAIRHLSAASIRPRGIAPRTYGCVVGVSLSSVHGVDAERLIDHAIDASITAELS